MAVPARRAYRRRVSTFGERMNEVRSWSSARQTLDLDVTVDQVPGIVRQAVASVPRLGVSELGPEAGTLFRKTTLAYRAGTIALTFAPQGSRTRVIAVTRSSMPLVGTDYGRGDKDITALFEAMRAAVAGAKPVPLPPPRSPSPAMQRIAIGRTARPRAGLPHHGRARVRPGDRASRGLRRNGRRHCRAATPPLGGDDRGRVRRLLVARRRLAALESGTSRRPS